MIRINDLKGANAALRSKIENAIKGRAYLHKTEYSLTTMNGFIFIVEPGDGDLRLVDREIRSQITGVRTEIRTIQSFDGFVPELAGRVCLIIECDIYFMKKSSTDKKRLLIFVFLFVFFLIWFIRHTRDYDLTYFKSLYTPNRQ